MGDAFEVSQPTIWRWLNQSKQIPHDHVLQAEKLTGVSRHDLRSDLYPVGDCACSRCLMVDRGTPGRFYGADRRMSSAADHYDLGSRLAASGG
jgi:hypothetical protein